VYLPARYLEASWDRRATDGLMEEPWVLPARATGIEEGTPELVPDDRLSLTPRDAVVLIVEDDPNFARVLLDLAHGAGFKGIVSLGGAAAVSLARQYRPAAVTLDIGLRDVSGWQVLESLREDSVTRDIPVHVVTVFEDAHDRFQQRGATT